MAVLFVVYMPNEDLEASECDDPLSPATLHQVANKTPGSDDDVGEHEKEAVAPGIFVDLGDDDEFSAEKPLLGNGCSDTTANVGSTSGNKPDDDDGKLVTKHQSLITLNIDDNIPRRASDNVLAKPENTQLIEGVSDSVVYKGDKVRFQVTKLDSPDSEGVKQPVAEVAASVADTVAETNKDENTQSLLTDEQEPDIVMERLTLKEVSTQQIYRLSSSNHCSRCSYICLFLSKI